MPRRALLGDEPVSDSTPTYQDLLSDPDAVLFEAEPDWLASLRRNAYEQSRTLGLPERRHEDWRSTDLSFLSEVAFREGCEDAVPGFAPDPAASADRARVVLVNGVFSQTHSRLAALPREVTVLSLAEASRKVPQRVRPYLEAAPKDTFFASLNTARFRDGLFLEAGEGANFASGIDIVLVSAPGASAAPVACHPRLVVAAGKGAALRLRIFHRSLQTGPALVNGRVDLFCAEGSLIECYHAQRDTKDTRCLLGFGAQMAARSRFAFLSFWGGEVLARTELDVRLGGEDASYTADGLAVLTGRSQVSQILRASHEASRGTGRQCFKNILTDRAQSEFNSLVHVAAGTSANDSDQLNRNLVLSSDARAYSRPQLRIDADEVKATHGSATGQMRERELFYLCSRGLSPQEARLLLVRGFAREVLDKIADDGLRGELESWTDAKLETMVKGASR